MEYLEWFVYGSVNFLSAATSLRAVNEADGNESGNKQIGRVFRV